jgi:hypothetical protein
LDKVVSSRKETFADTWGVENCGDAPPVQSITVVLLIESLGNLRLVAFRPYIFQINALIAADNRDAEVARANGASGIVRKMICSGRETSNRDMKNKRRIHSAEFKARIALEAVDGLKTVQQLATENGVHPTQVTQ